MALRRPASPTNTTFSGISNYRSDSYRPIRDKEIPPMPPIDSKRIAKGHWDELQAFLASHLAKEPPNSRSSAREKLTRLTRQQFQELSTDVYDELVRRTSSSEVPHLPNRDDFHPKRNQARQKLSTLAKPRFKDLASDVFFELGRRYPEFKEPEIPPDTPGSTYDEELPSPDYNEGTLVRPAGPGGSRPSLENPFDRLVNESGPSRGLSTRQASLDDGSNYTPSSNGRQPSNADMNPFSLSSLARPNNKASESAPAPSTATSGVVIPNKSTITEEEIQVPYGRDDGPDSMRNSEVRDSVASDDMNEPDEAPSVGGLNAIGNSKWKSPIAPLQRGLSALGKRLGGADNDDSDSRNRSTSNATLKGRLDGRPSIDQNEVNALKREYESKISTLQSRISSLEGEIQDHTKSHKSDAERIRTLTGELSNARDRIEDMDVQLRAARRNLDEAKAAQAQSQGREQRRQAEMEDEVRRLERRCEQLEAERDSAQSAGATANTTEELREEMQNLLIELTDLSARNDELMIEKDADLATVRDLEAQVADYRRKYERAKTDLRNIKATSSLFLQPPPKNEDQIPVSSNGVILDIHITAFQSASDALLTAGRSNAPSNVLTSMKSVIGAVTSIVKDAREFDPRSRDDVDLETVQSLCDRTEATLSNLVTAARTHATSYGLSPVSLLDAALSHVSASVTELTKLLLVRRSTAYGQGRPPVVSPSQIPGGLAALGGSRDDWKSPASNQHKTEGVWPLNVKRGRGTSDQSSSSASPPPSAVFDTPLATPRRPPSAESTPTDVQTDEGTWEELRPYLQTQSDTVIQAIQGVLSSVRSPTPSPDLAENLTQIITTVSSIVALCKGSLPASVSPNAQKILDQLSEHCNKLSEVQSMPSVTKEARGMMAQSSFSIANSIKALRAEAFP